jgi:hypothetical protein
MGPFLTSWLTLSPCTEVGNAEATHLARRLIENRSQNPHSRRLQVPHPAARPLLAGGMSLQNEHDAVRHLPQRDRFVANIQRHAIDQNVVEIGAQFLEAPAHPPGRSHISIRTSIRTVRRKIGARAYQRQIPARQLAHVATHRTFLAQSIQKSLMVGNSKVLMQRGAPEIGVHQANPPSYLGRQQFCGARANPAAAIAGLAAGEDYTMVAFGSGRQKYAAYQLRQFLAFPPFHLKPQRLLVTLLLLWQPLMGGTRRKCLRNQQMHRNLEKLGRFASGLKVLLLFPNDL